MVWLMTMSLLVPVTLVRPHQTQVEVLVDEQAPIVPATLRPDEIQPLDPDDKERSPTHQIWDETSKAIYIVIVRILKLLIYLI